MTNVTLSIEDNVYHLMKKYSEIKWSEFVRKAIQKRIEEMERLDKSGKKEVIMTMLASEKALKKDWDNKEDDRWNNV